MSYMLNKLILHFRSGLEKGATNDKESIEHVDIDPFLVLLVILAPYLCPSQLSE